MGRPNYPNKMYYMENIMTLEDINGDAIFINENGIILKDANGDIIHIGGR